MQGIGSNKVQVIPPSLLEGLITASADLPKNIVIKKNRKGQWKGYFLLFF